MNAPAKATARKPAPKKGPACPICNKPVTQEHRPFCSKRCAEIDLGRWLGGRYVVPGEKLRRNDIEEDEQG